MSKIVFRDLWGVSAIERQLDMQARDQLLDDELEELPQLIDDLSVELFGIRQRDTFYCGLPGDVRAQFGRAEWEAHFDALWEYSRDPNAHWSAFDLDVRCEDGRSLHCLEVFGRQLICALHGLHPQAVLIFANPKASKAA